MMMLKYSPAVFLLLFSILSTDLYPVHAGAMGTCPLKSQCSTNSHCAPWLECKNNSCICSKEGFFDGILQCDQYTGELSVLDCHCVTYTNSSQLVAAACVENCITKAKGYDYHTLFYPSFKAEENATIINKRMCEISQRGDMVLNRAGRLCGKCKENHSPVAYSFEMKCMKCPQGNRNLWKYFLIALGPLTVFYFIILFFKINVASSRLQGFVIFAQAISLAQFTRILKLISSNSFSDMAINTVMSLYGFWNLDFFRMFDWEICVDLQPLSARALDYSIAIYPFFLTIISYVLIELHDRNFRVLVYLWKPFRCVFMLFRRNWDIHTSVIDAYVTFYFLSSFKILCITSDMLIPVSMFSVGQNTTKLVLYYDGTVDYFGSEHLPYAIPAIVITSLLVILPVVIIVLNQCLCFQSILNYCSLNSNAFQTLMDSFQGCFKNGTEGTRDYRWFAAFIQVYRISMYFVFSITLGSLFFNLGSAVIFMAVILSVVIQPYKRGTENLNTINIAFYSLLGLLYSAISSMNTAALKTDFLFNGCYIFIVVVGVSPLIFVICLSSHWIYSRRKCGGKLINRIKAWASGYEEIEESLPHRLTNPGNYNTIQAMDETVRFEAANTGGIAYTD